MRERRRGIGRAKGRMTLWAGRWMRRPAAAVAAAADGTGNADDDEDDVEEDEEEDESVGALEGDSSAAVAAATANTDGVLSSDADSEEEEEEEEEERDEDEEDKKDVVFVALGNASSFAPAADGEEDNIGAARGFIGVESDDDEVDVDVNAVTSPVVVAGATSVVPTFVSS